MFTKPKNIPPFLSPLPHSQSKLPGHGAASCFFPTNIPGSLSKTHQKTAPQNETNKAREGNAKRASPLPTFFLFFLSSKRPEHKKGTKSNLRYFCKKNPQRETPA
eukprot:TRINITY_DN99_c5_g1_i2.p1 TRINITY_DN99_c5_g1~~TRINITY_DN99_c5_g1_i2.p1  ORF type:complete len:105 (+),score=7.10 TRINITY_DN99_c5_g1_i2:133-447(+)